MKRRTRRRNSAAGIAAALVTFSLGVTLAVVVTGSASASSPLTTSTSSSTSSAAAPMSPGLGLDPKAGRFAVINGTVSAASDHEIVASSAFPNYTTGAVDNYYSLARSHLDNSPFGEGLASPADTGPIGQTAAAGNFQQSQYADARWPGGPDTATYGSQGGPFADATAVDYLALANASEPSRALTGPKLSMPKGFDSKLQDALAQWKKKWASVLGAAPKPPTPPKTVTPTVPAVTTPKTPGATAPTVTVTTPIATVVTPHASLAPPASAPAPSVPSAGAPSPSRSVASASKSKSPDDGESLLTSSTQAALVPLDGSQTGIPKIDTTHIETTKTDTTQTTTTPTVTDPAKLQPHSLVLRGESSLGRVTLGGGQITVSGIHVKAAIANDGTSPTPAYEASVSVADASIAGVPVTIDESGVHVSGHTQGVPYGKISDSLNGALKQAGIQLFLVSPQVTTYSCGQPTTGTGTDTTSTTTSTSTDQSGATSSCGTCPPPGTGTGSYTTSTTTPTPLSTDQSSTTPAPGSCDQTGAGTGCDQPGAGTGTGTTTTGSTTTTPLPTTPTPSSSTTTSTTTSTTASPSWCAQSTPPSSCTTGTAGGTTPTTTATTQSPASPPLSSPMSPMDAASAGNEETVMATGLHVVFTQPVGAPGVPAQYVEHIFGQVFVDSLAALAPPLPKLDLSSPSSLSSACGGRHSRIGKKSGGSAATAGGGSSAGGSALSGSGGSGSGSLSASGSSLGSGSQLASGSTPGPSSGGGSFPASVVRALKKPLWLLLAYLVWQVLVIGTGASLWHWRKGGAA